MESYFILKLNIDYSYENEILSGGYSANYKIDEINNVFGSMHLSLDAGVILKLNYQRQNQTFSFPILLSDNLSVTSTIIGTLGGLIFTGLFDLTVIKSLKYWDKKKHEKSKVQQQMENMYKKKMEAKNYVFLILILQIFLYRLN